MSTRVNLLPKESADRESATRQRAMAGAGVLVLIIALGAVWFWKTSQVNDARAVLATEEAAAQELQVEIAELNEYAQIQSDLANADETVARVLSGEIGTAGILQDLAVVMPPGTELSDLDFGVTPDSGLVSVGQLVITGRTEDRHAPGLERLLLELDKIAAFRAPYFGSAAVDNDDAVAFDVSVQLGTEVLTRRYDEGIPEVLR